MARKSLAGLSGESHKKAKAEYMREYRKDNPDKFKDIDLKKRFGITLSQYTELLNRQNNVCAICGRPETTIDYRTNKTMCLAVDHDHDTGQVRGLLCMQCNRALGLFQDSIAVVSSAVNYLAKHKGA